MNSAPAADQSWSQGQDGMDPMVQMTSDLDDLSNIFNIDNFDLDAIHNLDGRDFADALQQSHPGTHPNTPFDESMGGLGMPPSTVAQDFGSISGFGMEMGMNGQAQFMDNGNASVNMPYGDDAVYQPSMTPQFGNGQVQQQFQYNPQLPFASHNHVPPTPNSYEMHGEAGRFLQQLDAQQRALMQQELHHNMRKNEQVQFTPMASPSGTPQFHMAPEFTVPGAYFSPLTSPALHAQNTSHMQQTIQAHHQRHHGYYTNPSTAPSSAAPSPVDPNADIEMGGDIMTLPEPAAQPKRSARKKAATPRSLAMSKVKQSPIAKPQKRKSTMLSSITTSKDPDTILQDAQKSGLVQPGSAGLIIPPAFESSENGSISPSDLLSDAVMGPPPKPGTSLSQSPAIAAQQDGKGTPGKAATPKSILSMKSAPASVNGSGAMPGAEGDGQGMLDDLELPAAAATQDNRRPSLARLDSQVTTSADHTPRIPARKTPKLGPLSTASSARPPSASASPSIMASPMTASTPSALLKDRKLDSKGGRGSKKRGSVGASPSAMVSPALRPKISPSIKPLLPEGTALNSPTHALLLASKSNYQNLLEGNRLPGVNYPDSLSTGLTSKRTSHKVAEQGRRNRINDALKEMQALIPSSKSSGGDESGAAADEGSPDASGPVLDADGKETKESVAKSNSSKAATVESANRYIRLLKEADYAQKAAILALKRENDEMKKRLGEKTTPVDEESETKGSPLVAEKTIEIPSPEAMDESTSPEAVRAES